MKKRCDLTIARSYGCDSWSFISGPGGQISLGVFGTGISVRTGHWQAPAGHWQEEPQLQVWSEPIKPF